MTLCSAVFVSKRDPADVRRTDLAGLHPLLGLTRTEIDRAKREVRANLLGFGRKKAVFRDGLGCTLTDIDAEPAPAPAGARATRPHTPDALDAGLAPLPPGADAARLRAAIDRAFAEPDANHPRHTRAVLVVLDGRLVAERYAPGFTAEMPLAGYSMTKTITGALAGVLIARGQLDPDAAPAIPAWRAAGDARGAISFSNVIHMTTGQLWSENVDDPRSAVLRMVYHERDAAAFAAALPMAHAPGAKFQYSSAASVLLARLMRTAMGDDAAYLALARTALFDPANMSSAVLAPDASGTLLGHAQAFATARDWARFGQVFLDDGRRNGVQVLPPGLVAAMRATEPASQARGYGQHVWVNGAGAGARPRPSLPEDAFLMNGQFGQLTAVVPSRGLVLVRLGDSRDLDFARDPDALVADILAAIGD